MIKQILLSIFAAGIIFTSPAQEQSQIALKSTGVQEFRAKYPEYDGRGTIIFIFDTGVDMGIDGLKTTSTGEVKVIDVQDFTGQGDLKLEEAEFTEKEINEKDTEVISGKTSGFYVSGITGIKGKSPEGKYFITSINEADWKNSGSDIRDLNNNDKTDDRFAAVVFQAEEAGEKFWTAVIDTDGDGSLENEAFLRNYKDKYDIFYIKNNKEVTPITFALNIFPEENRLSLFFDDGAHGTHCAGIAAGNQIGGADIYGVAPGAKIIALKLGNNNLSGGATVSESMKKAFEYADKVSKDRKEPCIINMSYGVGSEIEGRSEMEVWIDNLVKNNPYLYICVSNGNEGPGISTSGLPASSLNVFSSGAVLAEEVGRDVYGVTTGRDIILHFSSRGAEGYKPDVVSPGAAVSTVPNFMSRDIMWGTSMSSPYTTGVMSLLLSAMVKEKPDYKIPSNLLYKIVKMGAVPLEGYTHLDQGGGLINVMNAYNLLKKVPLNEDYDTYDISAFSPGMPNLRASAVYVRDASFIQENETFNIRIKRNNIIKKDKFYSVVRIESSEAWAVPVKKTVHFRNDQDADINIRIDKNKISGPGLYNAKITAFRKGNLNIPEFESMITLVVPHNKQAGEKTSIEAKGLKPGEHKRFFFKASQANSVFKVRLISDKNSNADNWFFVHEPKGNNIYMNVFSAAKEVKTAEWYITAPVPGVYEFVLLGSFRAASVSDVTLEVEEISVSPYSTTVISEDNTFIDLYNGGVSALTCYPEIKFNSFERNFTLNTNSKLLLEYEFTLNANESSREFLVEMSAQDFNKITDFALMIVNEKGENVETDGLSYRKGSISISAKAASASQKFKLTIIPGYAVKPSDIKVNVTEIAYLKDAKPIEMNTKRFPLYPSSFYSVKTAYRGLNLSAEETELYKDWNPKALLELKSEQGGTTFYELKLDLK